MSQSERGIPEIEPPPLEPLAHDACFGGPGGTPDVALLRSHFLRCGVLHRDDAIEILRRSTEVLRQEPNVLLLDDPVTICGDIHGQYYDLMTIFNLAGDPLDEATAPYLFLGDYVDRGCFSTEVTLLLMALKVRLPTRVWLLRGNHECRHLTSYFNFKEECLHKYDAEVYDAFQYCFDALPLAALLNDTFLCVHGGLSPDIKNVDDISLIDRFREPPTSGAMCDLLWSDPMEDEEEQMCPDALYLHNELRGCSYVFSYAAVRQFLAENQLTAVIRAHEAQDEGFRMFRKVEDTGFPSVICIFSAPNYCDTYDNKASVLQVTDTKVLHIKQYHSVEHPYVLPNFMNAFSWSLPFVFDKVADMIGLISGGASGARPLHFPEDEGLTLEHCLYHRAVHSASSSSSGEAGAMEEYEVLVSTSRLVRRARIIRCKVRVVARLAKLLSVVRQRCRSRGGNASDDLTIARSRRK